MLESTRTMRNMTVALPLSIHMVLSAVDATTNRMLASVVRTVGGLIVSATQNE